MSLEDSMKALADSNIVLAKALTGYAEVVTANTEVLKSIHASGGVAFVGASEAVAAGAADAAGKPGRKPRTTPAASTPEPEPENDPFADDEPETAKELTADDIKALLLKVRDKGGEKKNEAAARKIMEAVGAASIGKIAPKDYAKVAELAEKALK